MYMVLFFHLKKAINFDRGDHRYQNHHDTPVRHYFFTPFKSKFTSIMIWSRLHTLVRMAAGTSAMYGSMCAPRQRVSIGVVIGFSSVYFTESGPDE